MMKELNREEFRTLIKKLDPRKLDKFIEPDISQLFITAKIREKSLEYLIQWIYAEKSTKHLLGDAARCIQIILLNSTYKDYSSIEVRKNNKLLECIDDLENQFFDDKLNLILNENNIFNEFTLLHKRVGISILKDEEENIYLIFDIWHPQRDSLSYIVVEIKTFTVYMNKKVCKSLKVEIKSDYLLVGLLTLNNFLNSFSVIEYNINITAQEKFIFLYGSNHFGHFHLNILAQLNRIGEVLSSTKKTYNTTIILYWHDWKKTDWPDWIQLEPLKKNLKIKYNINIVPYSMWINESNKITAIPNGISGCRIKHEYGTFLTESLLLNTENKMKFKATLNLCIGIRCGSREVINQVSFNVVLLERLLEQYSSINLIIDGMFKSVSASTSTTLQLSMEKEEETVQQISVLLDYYIKTKRLNIISLVNKTFTEQIELIHRCDYVVAPLGSGFAKYQWVCKLPGIAIGASKAAESFENNNKISNHGVGLNFNRAFITWPDKMFQQDCLNNSFIAEEDKDYRGSCIVKLDAVDYIVKRIKYGSKLSYSSI